MTEIGKEYGAALFMLACEEKAERSYAEALDTVKQIFLEEPTYIEMLSSPSISLCERLNAIENAFKEAVPENVLSYLMLLCEKGRMPHFFDSVEEYVSLFNASERVSDAKITSAIELTEEEKQKLIKKLEAMIGGKVNVEYFTDAALLGGVIVEIDGKIIDGSLRHRLNDIKEVMNK